MPRRRENVEVPKEEVRFKQIAVGVGPEGGSAYLVVLGLTEDGRVYDWAPAAEVWQPISMRCVTSFVEASRL